jgi:hypothetical protein
MVVRPRGLVFLGVEAVFHLGGSCSENSESLSRLCTDGAHPQV